MIDDVEIGSHVAISEIPGNDIIRVYPNPTAEKIFIDPAKGYSHKVRISLIDGMGRVVLELPSMELSGLFQMDVSNLTDGVYCLIVQDGEMKSLKKIVIKK